jgi:benzodiazapine receptor
VLRNAIELIVCIAITFTAAAIGSRYMPGEWYASLAKPAWTPPNYVFAPVWTILYLLMGVAAWLVWRERLFADVTIPLTLFFVQLVLNTLWSYLFFGRHQIGLAALEIVVLWIVILLTIISFWWVRRAAAALLVPYLLWVGFAAVLNFQLWRLNIAR